MKKILVKCIAVALLICMQSCSTMERLFDRIGSVNVNIEESEVTNDDIQEESSEKEK